MNSDFFIYIILFLLSVSWIWGIVIVIRLSGILYGLLCLLFPAAVLVVAMFNIKEYKYPLILFGVEIIFYIVATSVR